MATERRRERKRLVAKGELVPGKSSGANYAKVGKEPTEEQHTKIIEWITAGNYLETAGAMAGVLRHELRAWIAAGERDPDGACGRFARDVKIAREKAQGLMVAQIAMAGQPAKLKTVRTDAEGAIKSIETREERGDWKATAWRLERFDPARFATKFRFEVEREMTNALEVIESVVDAETFARILDALSQLKRADDDQEG